MSGYVSGCCQARAIRLPRRWLRRRWLCTACRFVCRAGILRGDQP